MLALSRPGIFHLSALTNKFATPPNEKCPLSGAFALFCGERGIRTPGPVTVNGFQDRRIRPLCHLSGAKIRAGDFLTKLIDNIILVNIT
jgi:hypothetical protein